MEHPWYEWAGLAAAISLIIIGWMRTLKLRKLPYKPRPLQSEKNSSSRGWYWGWPSIARPFVIAKEMVEAPENFAEEAKLNRQRNEKKQ